MTTPTLAHAQRIHDLLTTHGLVAGWGMPTPGEMCIEALVAHVLGEPHGKVPSCVNARFGRFKMSLNDKPWSSPQARAKGLHDLGIAQLGSAALNSQLLHETLWFELRHVIANIAEWKGDEAFARKLRQSTTLKEAKARAYAYVYAYAYAYAYAYDYDYGYVYGYYKTDTDAKLTAVADIGVRVLRQLNCPGVAFLDEINANAK